MKLDFAKQLARGYKNGMLLLLSALFLLAAGCGQGSGSGSSDSSLDEGTGGDGEAVRGELPDTTVSPEDLNGLITDELSLLPYGISEEIWGKAEYQEPTGKWFMHNGAGVFGYGLTSGTQKAGDDFSVILIAHEENGVPLERDVRIQLTELDDAYEKKERLTDEMVDVEAVGREETIFTGILPEKENVSYLLSAEILDDKGDVEDTMVSLIYVPAQEINASLAIAGDDGISISAPEITLVLENEGPTNLFFGVVYTVEKKANGGWEAVNLDEAFISLGIILPAGESYEQQVDISKLGKGEYRITKEIQADGLDLTDAVQVEFVIE
ncbi:hypothetical protein SAMN05421736_101765 [Evansella caseinilytica]|uniref:Bacterial Ig-like domain-containing protein n=1 Tax=Evansella caseinilytica TaxID=1503961 RepID=A0A1H3IAD2_9BACI|nr:immunoglobulin-like domain-containing protein [Evansella caseinilytica]SDY24650.1 hypothetical protein SAMN05421736_101765 [Evansella caseinilytica]